MKKPLWVLFLLSFFVIPSFALAGTFTIQKPTETEAVQAILNASQQTNARASLLWGLYGVESAGGKILGLTSGQWDNYCKPYRDQGYEDIKSCKAKYKGRVDVVEKYCTACGNWTGRGCDWSSLCSPDDPKCRKKLESEALKEILDKLGYDRKDIPTSYTCAVGYTQFEPNIWQSFNNGKDGIFYNPWNINHAFLLAARNLQSPWLGADKNEALKPGEVIGNKDRIALQKYWGGGNCPYILKKECVEYSNDIEAKIRNYTPPELKQADVSVPKESIQKQIEDMLKQVNELQKQLDDQKKLDDQLRAKVAAEEAKKAEEARIAAEQEQKQKEELAQQLAEKQRLEAEKERLAKELQPPFLPEGLLQLAPDGKTAISTGGTTSDQTVIFRARVSDPNNDKVRLQVELRRIDEYNGNFDDTKGGLKDSPHVQSGAEAEARGADSLINGNYHWRARAIDEKDNKSDWVEFGNNSSLSTDFAVNYKATSPTPLPIVIPTPKLKITTPSLNPPTATVNTPYVSKPIIATGGKAPYKWSLNPSLYSGSVPLPPGLSINKNGVIEGTPTQAGTYNFTVEVKDSSGFFGISNRNDSLSVTLVVKEATTNAPIPCVTSGCSGEACVPQGERVETTCDVTPEKICLKEAARCERQPDNKCGWTKMPQYPACVERVEKELKNKIPQPKNCSDGTLNGQCSSVSKPFFCENGTLVPRTSQCECPTGQIVQGEKCTTPTDWNALLGLYSPDWNTKGYTSGYITDSNGVTQWYRKEGNNWVQKSSQAEAQEPYFPPVKPIVVCPQNYDPVCGVDGKTYYNQCVADENNVKGKYKGKCIGIPPPPPCESNWDCAEWSACVNNQQTQTCTDNNKCDKPSTSPPTTQSCVTQSPQPPNTSAPTANIKASASNIPYNSPVTISWTSTNATSCTVSPTAGWGGTGPTETAETLTSTKTYTLNCNGKNGEKVSDSVTVAVMPPTKDTPPPLRVSLTANPSSIIAGQSVSLTATVTATRQRAVRYTFLCTGNGTSDDTKPTALTNTNPYTINACRYPSPGIYTARVLVDAGPGSTDILAEDTVKITVTPQDAPPAPTNSVDISVDENLTIARGTTRTKTVTANISAWQNKPASFSISGLPSGAYGSFSPQSCVAFCTTTLTITTNPTTPRGYYEIVVTGTRESISDDASFTLTIQPQTQPPAPGNLQTTTLSSSEIALAWADTANNETVVRIERKAGSSGTFDPDHPIYNQRVSNKTSYNDTGLQLNTKYCYRVYVLNDEADQSDYSNVACAITQAGTPPPIPQEKPDLVITELRAPTVGSVEGTTPLISNVSITIANKGKVSAGPFRVEFYWSRDDIITVDDAPSGSYLEFGSGLGPGESITLGGPPQTEYRLDSISIPASFSPDKYYLGAIIDDKTEVEEGDETNNARKADTGIIDLKGLPSTASTLPENGAILNYGNLRQTFKWKKVDQADGYVMKIFTGWGCNGWRWGGDFSTKDNQITTDMPPPPDRYYSWQVFVLSNGAVSSPSECRGFQVFQDTPPSPPTNLTPTLSANGLQVTLKWTDTSSNELGFWIGVKKDSGAWVDKGINAGSNQTTTTVAAEESTACYRVWAYNTADLNLIIPRSLLRGYLRCTLRGYASGQNV